MRDYTATRFISADPDDVFRLLSDPRRLPDWNHAITRLVEAPDQLNVGSQWVVELSALGQSWPSRSTVVEIDAETRRFAYRSRTDDGNPSYADWTWQVDNAPQGCAVAVSLALHPATFWRRVLLAKVRGRQLRRHELPESLNELATLSTRVARP